MLCLCTFQSHASLLKVADELKDGTTIGLLSQKFDFEWRTNMINRFRSGEIQVLLSTYGYISGLKIPSLRYQAIFDVPFFNEGAMDINSYIAAIGCIGRDGKNSLQFVFLDEQELPFIHETLTSFQLNSKIVRRH